MDIREVLLHIRTGDSDLRIGQDLNIDRRTVKRYCVWGETQGLLSGELPCLESLHQLREQTMPTHATPQNLSSVEPYRESVSQWVQENVEMAAIHARLQERVAYTDRMDDRFLVHNFHLEGTDAFGQRDPQLRRLAGYPLVYEPPLLDALLADTPGIYALGGGRQVGKTTLVKQLMLRLLMRQSVSPQNIRYPKGISVLKNQGQPCCAILSACSLVHFQVFEIMEDMCHNSLEAV